ncbi:MAG TPA: VWA domain-containing protein [Vicinamibacterales bacterium]|nr:VWA domain-containing protein [Vicinamibacterales bacterium]
MLLANIDDPLEYRRLLDAANAANTSFYPIDPRGLAVFDSPISQPLPPQVDAAVLRTRGETLKTLAESTDGIAIMQNDLAAGLRRIVDDVSSYYLLGYYSTGKLDGRFHSIGVRVKRPGVQVRARRGYLAESPQSINAAAATAAATAAKSAAEAESHAMEGVLSPLAAFGREMPIRVQAATGWKPGGGAAVWMVGELGSSEEWKSGADADVTLTNSAGATLATAHATVPTGAIGPRTFRVTLAPAEPLAPGEYAVRVRARGAASTMATNETAHVLVAAAPEATGAIFIRRGLATGNKEVATADLRFRRSEQLRVEVPAAAGGTARLLDRTGKPLAVPVTAAVRDDADGSRWQTAQLALAPLAPGDYVIELSRAAAPSTVTRTLVAFRVVP